MAFRSTDDIKDVFTAYVVGLFVKRFNSDHESEKCTLFPTKNISVVHFTTILRTALKELENSDRMKDRS